MTEIMDHDAPALDPAAEFRRLADMVGANTDEVKIGAHATDAVGLKLDGLSKQMVAFAKVPMLSMSPAAFAGAVDAEIARRLRPDLTKMAEVQSAQDDRCERAESAAARSQEHAFYAYLVSGVVAMASAGAGLWAVRSVPPPPEKVICVIETMPGSKSVPGPQVQPTEYERLFRSK